MFFQSQVMYFNMDTNYILRTRNLTHWLKVIERNRSTLCSSSSSSSSFGGGGRSKYFGPTFGCSHGFISFILQVTLVHPMLSKAHHLHQWPLGYQNLDYVPTWDNYAWMLPLASTHLHIKPWLWATSLHSLMKQLDNGLFFKERAFNVLI